MPISGNKMHDPNFRLRFLLLVFCGIIAGAAILYWRTEILASQEYIEFPVGTSISSSRQSNKPANVPKQPVRKDLKGYEDLYK